MRRGLKLRPSIGWAGCEHRDEAGHGAGDTCRVGAKYMGGRGSSWRSEGHRARAGYKY